MKTETTTPSGCSVGAGSAILHEWMNTPEKRRAIFAWQALAAAFTGNKEKADEYAQRAKREDAKCALPRLPNARGDT